MTRRRKERAASNSMSCTDDEWARIRAAAAAAGEGIGRHVVRRCLTEDPSPNAKPRASQALSPQEQREMHEAVLRLDADSAEHGNDDSSCLGSAVRILCEDRIVAMEREGRSEELQALLRDVFGDAGPAVAAECLASPDDDADAG
ncbi:MAG: hypothetical protein F4145_11095 [Boseongicola sp. SB0675_bin_26]|nr:hypothetical protein [Boseongicola sp. SB0675_bin_26]